jgi:hypothetical protein
MTQVRFDLVLAPGTRSKEVIPNVEAACRTISATLQVSFTYVGQEHPGEGVTAEVWEDRHAGKIKLVDDTKMPAVYVAPFVRPSYGPDFIYFTLADNLPHVEPSELRDMAERGEPNRVTALQRLGLGETEDYDARTARILIDGVRSRDVDERRAATLAIFLLKWGAFGPALDTAIVAETDENLKAQQTVTRRYLQSSLII